jgi:hypothetical protein
LFDRSARRWDRSRPDFPIDHIPMTTCRGFAARRLQPASAGLQPRCSPVTGSIAMAGWNAAGIPRPATRQPADSMTNGIRGRTARAPRHRPGRVAPRWPDGLGMVVACNSIARHRDNLSLVWLVVRCGFLAVGRAGLLHRTVFELSYRKVVTSFLHPTPSCVARASLDRPIQRRLLRSLL